MFDKGIVVSCQPRKGGPFTHDAAWRFAEEAQLGGAVAVRIEGFTNVSQTARVVKIPVIGLVKKQVGDIVAITPTYEDAQKLSDEGARYIAVDATGRFGHKHIEKMVGAGFNVIADVATFGQAKCAEKAGCVAITTALSGYTQDFRIMTSFEPPDLDLVGSCAKYMMIPTIAEGRYLVIDEVEDAFNLGAYAVCMGAMITLPHFITKFFAGAFK